MEGELRNVQGVVVSVNVSSVRDDIVVKMDHEALEENLTFTSNMLKKHINIGENVKIVSGTHVGETGMVVHTENAGDREGVAVVINDNGGKELRVFVSDLHPTTEISRGHDTLEGYNLHDLVQLPSNEVGVIVRCCFRAIVFDTHTHTHTHTHTQQVRVGRSDLTVLHQEGDARVVNPSQLRGT